LSRARDGELSCLSCLFMRHQPPSPDLSSPSASQCSMHCIVFGGVREPPIPPAFVSCQPATIPPLPQTCQHFLSSMGKEQLLGLLYIGCRILRHHLLTLVLEHPLNRVEPGEPPQTNPGRLHFSSGAADDWSISLPSQAGLEQLLTMDCKALRGSEFVWNPLPHVIPISYCIYKNHCQGDATYLCK